MGISAADVKKLRDLTNAGMMDCKKALQETDGDMEKAKMLLREKGLADAAKRAHRTTSEGVVKVVENDTAVALAELNSETDFVARNDMFQSFADEMAQYVLTADADVDGEDDLSDEMKNKLKEIISTIGENITVGKCARMKKESDNFIATYVHGGGRIASMVRFKLSDGSASSKDEFQSYARDIAMQVASMAPVALDRDSVPESVVEEQKAVLRKQAQDTGKPAEIIEKMLDGQINKFFKEITLVDQAYIKDGKMTVTQLTKEIGNKVGADIKIDGYVRIEVGADSE